MDARSLIAGLAIGSVITFGAVTYFGDTGDVGNGYVATSVTDEPIETTVTPAGQTETTSTTPHTVTTMAGIGDLIAEAPNCTALDDAITLAQRQPTLTEWIQVDWFTATDRARTLAGEALARGATLEALYCDQIYVDLVAEARARLADSGEGIED